MSSGWHNVSRREPCPVCHKPDWCSLSNDGQVCVCRRVESSHPCRSGSGWVHRLTAIPPTLNPQPSTLNPQPPTLNPQLSTLNPQPPTLNPQLSTLNPQPPTLNFTALHASFDGDVYMQDGLAQTLGLDGESFAALDVRFNHANGCMSFPMRDGDGNITGLRYRELGTNRKWSARGSKDGLFYSPSSLKSHLSSPSTPLSSPTTPPSSLISHLSSLISLVILEGPTDTAAAMAIGLPAVGRSSCLTGTEPLRQLIRRLRINRLTIVADRDVPHRRPDGSEWFPGLDGARRLGAALHHTYRIVLPPPGVKDMRDWYRRGDLTAEAFARAAASAAWRVS